MANTVRMCTTISPGQWQPCTAVSPLSLTKYTFKEVFFIRFGNILFSTVTIGMFLRRLSESVRMIKLFPYFHFTGNAIMTVDGVHSAS